MGSMGMPGEVERDRDVVGRARNGRPRDELGRPLSHGSAGVVPIPDDLSLSPAETLESAQALIDIGRAFQAHEVLESTWKAAPEAERELWRGLAQLAVGLTHALRGNPVGAVQLLTRAADRIDGYATAPPYGIDVSGLVDWARAVSATIEQDGLDGLPPARLHPQLRRQ